jgi:hypothetical protein
MLNQKTLLGGLLILWVCASTIVAVPTNGEERDEPRLPMRVPVLVIKYFPVRGDLIDVEVTGDCGAPLDEMRLKTDEMTRELLFALQQGSRYHGYKNRKAPPSLAYTVLRAYDFLEPLPTIACPGEKVPLTDYSKIMQRVNIRQWVEQKSVKEVWLWGYHGGVLNLWESNMSGPYGNISGSNRDPKDLPVLKQTYTVYHYNDQRGTSEAMEDTFSMIST